MTNRERERTYGQYSCSFQDILSTCHCLRQQVTNPSKIQYNNPQSHTCVLHFQGFHLNLKVLILTSETPTPCCPEGTPVWFSASEKYSGSGRHAVEEENKPGRKTREYVP